MHYTVSTLPVVRYSFCKVISLITLVKVIVVFLTGKINDNESLRVETARDLAVRAHSQKQETNGRRLGFRLTPACVLCTVGLDNLWILGEKYLAPIEHVYTKQIWLR